MEPFPRSSSSRIINLPAYLSSFVGREREIVEITRLLSRTRLLTLTGPGGCGKTRLAIQVALDLPGRFTDEVWFVDLAPLADPELLPQAVAAVLGVYEQPDSSVLETLADTLQHRYALLALDNCEHLLTAAIRLCETLLQRCPHVQIMTTSRERLNIGGEIAWLVPPLSFPDVSLSMPLPPLEHLMQYEAIQLFVERVSAILPAFTLTGQNARAVIQVCSRLDGVPLALELTAARMSILSVEQIAKRLDDCFSLLTGGMRGTLPRQQTLRATMNWSYDLLSREEKALFGRLAVFAGSFTLEAVEAICAGEIIGQENLLDLLAHLVNKSLLVVEQRENRAWYRLLETMRQDAQEKLQQSGETETIRERHRDWYLELAKGTLPELAGLDQQHWLDRLEIEHDNLRAALEWTWQRGEAEIVVLFSIFLNNFWRLHNHIREGCRWMEMGLMASKDLPDPLRAGALSALGVLTFMQGEFKQASKALEESLALFEEQGNRNGMAFALRHLAYVLEQQGSYEHAKMLLEKSLILFRQMGNEWGMAFVLILLGNISIKQGELDGVKALYEEGLRLRQGLGDTAGAAGALHNLGHLAMLQGDYAQATPLLKESLALFQVVQDKNAIGIALHNLGLTALEQHDIEQAERLLEESLMLFWNTGNKADLAEGLEGLASVADERQQPERAARLWGAAENLRIVIGTPLDPFNRIRYLARLDVTRSRADEASFAQAWREGQHMPLDQVIDYAFARSTALSKDTDTSSLVAITPNTNTSLQELRICSLGQAQVYRGAYALTSADWIYTKGRELFFYLLCHRARTKEQIGIALWPDVSSTQLRNNFRVTLYHLRRALGHRKWITFNGEHYAFDHQSPYWFDVEAFENAVTTAWQVSAYAPAQAISYMEKAIDLYQGDFLEDMAAGDWSLLQRDALRRRYTEALLTLGQWFCAQENYAQAASAFRRLIASDSYHEVAHRELMRCYARLGERGQALKCYSELLERMRDELHSTPDSETTSLFEKVRRGDPI